MLHSVTGGFSVAMTKHGVCRALPATSLRASRLLWPGAGGWRQVSGPSTGQHFPKCYLPRQVLFLTLSPRHLNLTDWHCCLKDSVFPAEKLH